MQPSILSLVLLQYTDAAIMPYACENYSRSSGNKMYVPIYIILVSSVTSSSLMNVTLLTLLVIVSHLVSHICIQYDAVTTLLMNEIILS